MKKVISVISAALLCYFTLLQGAAHAAEKRVALVIGNSEYEYVSNLENPAKDAEDIGRALGRLGFAVTMQRDLDFKALRLALRDFGEVAEDADIALIYFAGHGIEIDKTNYLIPVNAELKSDRDVDFEAIRLDTVINSLDDARGVRIVLLDACRNNPFVAEMERTTATRSIGRGLSRIDPGGVLVGYAARGGTVALDGEGRNSPYAKAILANIEEPGLEIGKFFRRVRDSVLSETGGFQEPFTYGSLPGADIFLVPPIEVAAVATPQANSVLNQMLDDFAAAEKYGSLNRWTSFLLQYEHLEDNKLVRIAMARKSQLEKEKARNARSANRAPLLEPKFDARGQAVLDRDQVRLVQKALSYMGQYTGPLDGSIGPMTSAAVSGARFQAGLTPGTRIDKRLLAALPDVDATDTLRSRTSQFYDLDEIPPGLDPRLEKALKHYSSQTTREQVMFDYFAGHLYLAVLKTSGNFSNASNMAAKAGGHLVTIQSAAENRFLIEFFSQDARFRKTESGTLYGPMIGLYQPEGSAEPRGGWTWVTGEPLSYTTWSPGNPDNFNGRQNRARFFLSKKLVRPGAQPRYWDDTSDGLWGLGYLVEIE